MGPVSEDAVEQIDQRNLWRRAEDVRRNVILISLSAVLVAMGVAWGTAAATVGQKVDRTEFREHVIADSVRRLSLMESLRRIEVKQDSTNDRLSRLICDNKPAYCR